MRPKCIILFSSKCSGSSALQQYLIENYWVKVIAHTPHHEHESLFWTKAASSLGLKQLKMHRSSVPYSAKSGGALLSQLLRDNGVTGFGQSWDKEKVFEGFKNLVIAHSPVFFEKSPHHLFNQSNIQLMLSCQEYFKNEIDFYFIGLIRNPMDTVYSAYKRWQFSCSSFEKEWRQSYDNLLELSENDKLTTFRYEDLVRSTESLDDFLISKCDLIKQSSTFQFNSNSLSKWRKDLKYVHPLDFRTLQLARSWGFKDSELINLRRKSIKWMMNEYFNSVKYRLRNWKRLLVK